MFAYSVQGELGRSGLRIWPQNGTLWKALVDKYRELMTQEPNAAISRPMFNNVILVGFMGAGKSSVGRILARRLGRCFVETDDMIVAKEGMSIAEIFTTRGEPYFRALEENVVNLLALKRDDVIATGGGLPCREGRPEMLRTLGTMVWLSGDFETLYERAVKMGQRPMLASRSREDAEALYRARTAFYCPAHLSVDTTALGPDQVAARVIAELRTHERTRHTDGGAVRLPVARAPAPR